MSSPENFEVNVEGKEFIDLTNEEVISDILRNGPKKRLELLADYHNFSQEQIKLFVDFEKLREKVHTEMHEEFEKRILSENFNPTEEELLAGVYRNEIEPQAREAVFLMRKKGYNTYESGFYGYNKQRIGVTDNSFEKIELPFEIIEKARKVEIEIKITPDAIELICQKYIGLEELKEIWDSIAGFLPNRGRRAERAEVGAAENFLKRIANIREYLKK